MEMSSRFNNEAYILDVLASPMPCHTFDVKRIKFLETIPLADPNFWTPGEIDVILGVELFLPTLRMGQITDEADCWTIRR